MGHRLVGIYIDLAAELDASGAQRTIHVRETTDGTILLTSPNPASALAIVLQHITGAELRSVLEGLYARDVGGPQAKEA